MAVLPILIWPDDRLANACDPVVHGDGVARLAADLFETMYAAPGRGLAAPQVGVLIRLFVMDTTWKTGKRSPLAFVNPRITGTSEAQVVMEEVCLSIPGITAAISRPEWVELTWTDPEGRVLGRKFEGAEARCAQHEIDHLDGIVTLHHLGDTGPGRSLSDHSVPV